MVYVESKIHESPSFQIALETHSQKYGYDSVDPFEKCSVQDVFATISRIEDNRNASGKLHGRARACLLPLITFVDRYAKAVDVLVQAISGACVNPAALIWGLLRILLEVASSSAKYYGSLLGVLEEIGSTVSLYTKYEELFLGEPRFERALVDVYMDIIAVLTKARKVFRMTGYKQFLRCFRSNFESDFRDEISSIKRHLTMLESETTLAHRSQVHRLLLEKPVAAEHFSNSSAEAKLTQAIHNWLAPLDYHTRLVEIESSRQKDTGKWILYHQVYTMWKENYQAPSLWITGSPGVGKTVLSSAIISNLKEQRDSKNELVLYFHCGAAEQQTSSAAKFYASIITQIISELRMSADGCMIPPCLRNAYDRSIKFGRPLFSEADLPDELLLQLISSYKRTLLVLDGLDEMTMLQKLAKTLLEISAKCKSFRTAFISRDILEVREILIDLPRIDILPSDVQQDINRYVRRTSRNIFPGEDQVKQEMIEEICAKAEGMFLWARMVLESLSTATNLAQCKEMLQKCPPRLYAVYRHFLQDLYKQPPSKRHLARDILRWVCCATRPLTVRELEIAVSTTALQGLLPDEQRPFRSVILEVCRPFINVSPDGEHVQPVHYSIREYIRENPSLLDIGSEESYFLTPEQDINAELSMRCIKYLKSTTHQQVQQSDNISGFDHYAMTCWCHHAVHGSFNTELEKEIYSLISSPEQRKTWLFWMLFKFNQPFPFQKIFLLQKGLREWTASLGQNCSPLAELVAKDWSMDALDLLVGMNDKVNHHSETSGICNNFKITYFEKMMVVRDLARRLTQNGELSCAAEKLERLRMAPKNTTDSAQLICLLNILGIIYDQQGRLELSLHIHRKALSAQEAQLGSEHPQTLWTLNELGRMYRHSGLLEKSEIMHKKALEILSSTLPEDHPECIWTINTLATTIRKQNRPADAMQLHLKAYEARRRSLGEDHAHTLWSCGDIAKCYRDLGQFQNALSWHKKALVGRRKTLGCEQPDTIWTMNDMGVILAKLARYSEAIEVQSQALEAQERVLGREHKHTKWTKEILKQLIPLVEDLNKSRFAV